MSELKGMLSLSQLSKMVESNEIETVLLVFTDVYGRFMGKRFDAEFFIKDTASHGGHVCNYLLAVDMEMVPVEGYQFASWERGYGDYRLIPDLSTLRIASWLDKTAMAICDLKDENENFPPHVPRSMLKAQIEKAKALDYSAKASSELEYYIFNDSYREAYQKGYLSLQPAGWYSEDYHALQGMRVEPYNSAVRKHLKLSGIPVENSKGETGIGQHELNVRYADVLAMADRHSIYKQCMKEIAETMGISVTFMAKYCTEDAGSSCHIHLSLWKEGKNAFAGFQALGQAKCSNIFKWFLGGWMAHTPELMVFYAPTVNSYKRYQAGSWAPTRIAWSYDNRTAGFRIVGTGNSLRIECRIPGADCNPYLVYAAALASGLDGIQNQINPPPIFEGDVYTAETLPRVPLTFTEAIAQFEKSEFVRQAFGEEVVAHYVHHFKTEQSAYDNVVTDWERKRYFERI
ncbi:glutamine synthetase family protein [Deltaproteobacteria bacterium TL4]